MYPGTYAAEAPDRIAAVMAGTGETISYGDLERRSAQLAHVLHQAGLRPGHVVALLTENNVRFVDALPRSEAGKLMKSQLKAKYAAS